MTRKEQIDRFYRLLDELEQQVGGKRKLKNCDGYMDWPARGVYFFFEPGTKRDSTDQLRVTRIGANGVAAGSSASLWDRLKQHYGTGSGSADYSHGGYHRGSVYRKYVGEAIIEKYDLHDDYPDWKKTRKSIERDHKDVRDEEYILERRVSTYIREQPFIWVEVEDEPSSNSDRTYLEQNIIALLSNFDKQSIDSRTEGWLGNQSPRRRIRESGLWCLNHVDEEYDSDTLDLLENYIKNTIPP